MKITYEEFLNKLKPEIKDDLKTHKEKEWLKRILDIFYYDKLDTYQNEDRKNDERLEVWTLCFYDCIKAERYFKDKKYKDAFLCLSSIESCTGSFGYAIIKMYEELFYDI